MPMGYRGPDGTAHGPFALDNAKIRIRWLALEGVPGAPLGDDWSDICYESAMGETIASTLYIQEFERGYIQYCGSGNAEYVPYGQTYLPNIVGRYTCGAGDNSFVVVTNNNPSPAIVSIVLYKSDGTVRDSRVHTSLGLDETWVLNVHNVVFDWLITGKDDSGIFQGWARIYYDQMVNVRLQYISESCEYMPVINK
jgi:hypothetical protein